MIKPVITWILVADAGRARVVQHDGPGRGLQAVPRLAAQQTVPANQDEAADRQGRSFARQGPGRSAMERPSEPARLAKKAFAKDLAAMLTRELDKGSYDRLIVVAPPTNLGDLRAAVSDRVRATISHEIDKDLTHVPVRDLAAFLEPVLAV